MNGLRSTATACVGATRKGVTPRVVAFVVCAALLSACGGDDEDDAPSVASEGFASGFRLGHFGGFVYDDDGIDVELNSTSDFDTIASLATAVTAARNTATFVAQRYARWQDTFGAERFPSNTNWSYSAINLEFARGAGLTGAGRSIAIYDNGFRFSHEELSAAGRTVTDVNGAAVDGHGTAVASIAGGSANFGRIEGVAPGANLRLYGWTTLGGQRTRWETSIRDAANHGVIAHNNSWALSDGGGTIFGIASNDLSLFEGSFPEERFLESLTAFTGETVVVFAADNDETRVDSQYLAALPVLVPELERGWLKAINLFVPYDPDSDTFGTPVRLSAGCLEAARWCLGADGSTVFANATSDTGYSVGTGASFAAPQVSGALALLAEAFPALEAPDLRNRLLASADNTFFTHTGAMEFEGGFIHGYNAEFGHGLMDLRAALLPIGTMSTLSAEGAPLIAGEASVVAGGAGGAALFEGLSEISVLSTDQMGGDYQVSAASFAARSTRPSPLIREAERARHADLEAERAAARARLGATPGGNTLDEDALFSAFGGSAIFDVYGGRSHAFTEDNTQLSVLLPEAGEDALGFGAAYLTRVGRNSLRLGFSAVRDADSVLGIEAASSGDAFNSITIGLELAASIPLNQRSAFGLSGHYGVASAEGAGLISDFGQLSYSTLGVSFDRSDVFRNGDALTFHVERPVRVENGSAYVEVASGRTPLNALEYATHEIDLRPSASQLDLGFDFRSPINENTEFHLGFRRSLNNGHVEGAHSTVGLVRLRWTF